MVQLDCAASVGPQVVPDWVKSPGFAPVKVTLLNVTTVLWWLLTVTVLAAVGLLSPWLPNPRVVGETVTGCTPVPLSVTVWGLLPASSEMVSVAVRAPVASGEN